MSKLPLRFRDLGAVQGKLPAAPAAPSSAGGATEVARDEANPWRDSSLELEQGLDWSETPIDSLPGDLREAFE